MIFAILRYFLNRRHPDVTTPPPDTTGRHARMQVALGYRVGEDRSKLSSGPRGF